MSHAKIRRTTAGKVKRSSETRSMFPKFHIPLAILHSRRNGVNLPGGSGERPGREEGVIAAQCLGAGDSVEAVGGRCPADKTIELLRLVDDFYGSDLCVIYLRREGKQ